MNQKLPPTASRAEVAAMNDEAHAVIARQASRDPRPVAAQRRTTSCGCLTYRLSPAGVPEVLLVKPWARKPTWGMPKGHVIVDADGRWLETAETCAWRETFEETGVQVTLEDELPQTNAQSLGEDKTVRSFLAVPSFPGDPATQGRPVDGENVAVQWHPIDHLPPIHAYQVSVIAAALPIIRQRLALTDA